MDEAEVQEIRDRLDLPESGGVGELYANVARALEALIENIAAFPQPITIPVFAENEPWLILFAQRTGWQFEWEPLAAVTEEEWFLATLTPPQKEPADG